VTSVSLLDMIRHNLSQGVMFTWIRSTNQKPYYKEVLSRDICQSVRHHITKRGCHVIYVR